jgi:hypothetical protein
MIPCHTFIVWVSDGVMQWRQCPSTIRGDWVRVKDADAAYDALVAECERVRAERDAYKREFEAELD